MTTKDHISALNLRRAIDGRSYVNDGDLRIPVVVPHTDRLLLADYHDAKAAEILRAAGLPPGMGSRSCKAGTAEWYAALIRENVAELRLALAMDNRKSIVTAAIRFGSLIREAEIVLHHGDVYVTGSKVRGGLASRRDAHNAPRMAEASKQHKRWIAEARAIWRDRPRLSTSRCADRVIERLKLPVTQKTVADVVRRYNPKKVGGAS